MEIPFRILEIDQMGYHLLVDARVNGLKANILIDTGASRTVIDLNRLDYFFKTPFTKVYDKSVTGVGMGPVSSYVTRIQHMELGMKAIEDFEVVAIDMGSINRNYAMYDLPHIDMVLGSDLLLKLGACIDYQTKILTLRP